MMHTIDWHNPETLHHDGVNFAYWEAGPKDSKWPSLIFSHGFPELAYSWRHQMEALSKAGFHCIAMDQRGYGFSDCPEDITAYTMEKLCGDLDALCAHLSIERAVFVGHDWGGMIVWQMPLRHPERVAGIIALNTPYTKRAPTEPIALYRRRFGDDFYIVWFQTPGEAESLMDADIEKTLTYFAQCPPKSDGSSPDTRQGSSLKDTLLHFDEATARPRVMDDQSFAYYVDRFSATGFRGGINWYRNFDRNWHESANQADLVTSPSLMITAELDPVLPPEATNGMERYVKDLERVMIRESGHWTQQEQPVAVNNAISTWVKMRFPAQG